MVPGAIKTKIISDLEELILSSSISEYNENIKQLRNFADKGHYQTAFIRKIQDKKKQKGLNDTESLPDPERLALMTVILIMADSMHAVKTWETSVLWFGNELKELQQQGIEENKRMMPKSTMTEITSLKSMVSGIIDCTIMPIAETLALVLPNTDILVDRLRENREIWEFYYESNEVFEERKRTLARMSRLRAKLEKLRREEDGLADTSFAMDLSDKIPLFVSRLPSGR